MDIGLVRISAGSHPGPSRSRENCTHHILLPAAGHGDVGSQRVWPWLQALGVLVKLTASILRYARIALNATNIMGNISRSTLNRSTGRLKLRRHLRLVKQVLRTTGGD